MGIKIVSIGASVPERVLTNQDLENMVETSNDWIVERTGIKERRISDNGILDISVKACRIAVERANLNTNEIDLILVATITPEYLLPSTGCLIQKELEVKDCPAFDISAACSGFIYGLVIAEGLSKRFKKILFVAAEALSKFTDYQDRNTCILFGDGASAVILEATEESNLVDFDISADGNNWELLYIPAGGAKFPSSEETVKKRLHYMKMQGRDVFKNAVKNMETSIIKILQRNNLTERDIDLFVPHQANIRIIESLRKKLDFPEEKVYVNIDRYGNTSAASIGLALFEAEQRGKLKKGDVVLLSAFGAGFTWASAILRW